MNSNHGFFDRFGGKYVAEVLKRPLDELEEAFRHFSRDPKFSAELQEIRRDYIGRETPLLFAPRATAHLGGAQMYLKLEGLANTGANKINNAIGQVLLAKYMGKKRIIAETGAGQHGVALATAAAYFGLECDIYMGEVDIAKQAPNVSRMRILGARVIPVSHGLKTLKEAVDAAFEAYMKEYKDAIYCIGSVVGPHPFPMMVRDFQTVVGIEAREQFQEMTGLLPDAVCACVGGGSNSIGMFVPFLADPVEIIGVEPLGRGEKTGDHAATMKFGTKGILHGFESYLLQDENGAPLPVYSVASGLDYPATGPEHAYLKDVGRVRYETATDREAVEAFFALSRYEGIIPALESSHALAYAIRAAKTGEFDSILVNLSGRGDKDMDYVIENFGYGEDLSI